MGCAISGKNKVIRCPHCRTALAGKALSCSGCGFNAHNGRWFDFEPEDSADSYFDEVEFRYRFGAEESHYWHRARRYLLLDVVSAFVPPGTRILEVGSGCGYLSSAMAEAGFLVWALDLSETALGYCSRLGLDSLCKASITELPFAEEFDAACAFDVLEHIPDHERGLENLVRAVAPGGLIFITVPAHPHIWGSWDRKQRHVRRYREDDLRLLLEAQGLKVLLLRQFFRALYLPCLMAAMVDRLLGGKRRKDLPINQHHAMWSPPLMSTLAYRFLVAERQDILQPASGLGTSLLAVAQRDNP